MGRVAKFLIRVSGISLGANGAGLVQLRHREELMARQSGQQKKGRREALRQALRSVPHLRVVGCLRHAFDNLGLAAAGAVEVAGA